MPLHPQAQAILDQVASLGGSPLHTLTAQEARAQSLARRAATEPEAVGGGAEDRAIPGPGGPIPIRIYRPGGPGPTGAIVAFHAGGWVLGDLDAQDPLCRALCNQTGATVVGVDYRLAPETRFPGAAEDAYAAVCWVAEHADEIGVDADRLAVLGESAGGNLAAVVSLMARDLGGPRIRHQALLYAVLDSDFTRPSYVENAEGYLLLRDGMLWFWDLYTSGPEDYLHPHAAPMRAPDHSGLPPAHIITAEYDPLRDEGAAYAERLAGAGVDVEYACYPGMVHMFVSMSPALDDGRAALEAVTAKLRAALS